MLIAAQVFPAIRPHPLSNYIQIGVKDSLAMKKAKFLSRGGDC